MFAPLCDAPEHESPANSARKAEFVTTMIVGTLECP